MTLTRRIFAKSIGFALASVCCLPALQGCSSATVATFVATIAKYAAQLATYFGSTSIAAQITALAATIATDIANWQNGSAATDAIQALTLLASLVNQIPIAAPYAVLIDLILGAISGLLALLPQSVAVALVRDKTGRTVPAIPYKGFDKKTMTAANDNFIAAWQRYTTNLPIMH